MNRIEDFRVFYNQSIHPELMRLDRKRRRLLRLIFVSTLLLMGIIVFELMLNILVVTLVMMIPIVFYITYLSFQVQKFRQNFKPKVVELILDFIDDDPNFGTLSYKAKKKIPLETFMKSNIFEVRPAVYEGEDYIAGRFGEIEFELSELNVREFSRVRNRLNYVFRGVFLHAKFNHFVKGRVLILPRDFRQYLSRTIKKFNAKGGKSIDPFIKNQKFKKEFMSMASQDANIRDLLSKDMQNAILKYIDKADKYVYFSFQGNNIYIAVTEPKDLLEPKLLQSNVSFDLVKEFFEDIHLLLRVVEDFDLNH